MFYLTAKQILLLHAAVIAETGGGHGVRDLAAVEGIEQSPKQSFGGQELYPTIFLKAAVYAREIITRHPFLDGNKRGGMVVAGTFLRENGYLIGAKEKEIEHLALKIANEKLSLEEIAKWFEKRSRPVEKRV